MIFSNCSEKPKICISRSFSTEAISRLRASSRVLSNSIHARCRLSEVGADDDRRAALGSRYGHHHELLPHIHLRQLDFRRRKQVCAAHPAFMTDIPQMSSRASAVFALAAHIPQSISRSILKECMITLAVCLRISASKTVY